MILNLPTFLLVYFITQLRLTISLISSFLTYCDLIPVTCKQLIFIVIYFERTSFCQVHKPVHKEIKEL
jgi:hypothetical protein